MPHVDPEQLALIALGTEPVSPQDEEHLQGCESCRSELEALRRTARTARAALDVGELEQPSEAVWERILDDIEGSRSAQRHHLAGRRRPHLRRRIGAGWIVAGAVATVAVAGAVVWAVATASTPQVVALPAHPDATGEASVRSGPAGHETLQVAVTGTEAPRGYYEEVWLMSTGAASPISMGRLEGASGVFEIPAGVDLVSYPVVDVSLEPDDGDPSHSGDSVTRGRLRLE